VWDELLDEACECGVDQYKGYDLLRRACEYDLKNKNSEFLLKMKRWLEKLEREALCRECFPSGIESLDLIVGLVRAKHALKITNATWPKHAEMLIKQKGDFIRSALSFFGKVSKAHGHNCVFGDLLQIVTDMSNQHHSCIDRIIEAQSDFVPNIEGLEFDTSWTCKECFSSDSLTYFREFEKFRSLLWGLNSAITDFVSARARIIDYREDLHQKLEIARSFYEEILNGHHDCRGSEYVRASFQDLIVFEAQLRENLHKPW
jgi:hypothetical protein